MYHVRHILIPLTLRHSLLLPRAYSPLLLRQFSVTPRPQAAVEDEDSFISKFKNTSIFQKLADKPEALSAIQAFAEVLQKSGIEMSSTGPSTMQLMRLAANSEFRTAVQRVVSEMKNAGVDLNSAEAMEEIMRIQKGR